MLCARGPGATETGPLTCTSAGAAGSQKTGHSASRTPEARTALAGDWTRTVPTSSKSESLSSVDLDLWPFRNTVCCMGLGGVKSDATSRSLHLSRGRPCLLLLFHHACACQSIPPRGDVQYMSVPIACACACTTVLLLGVHVHSHIHVCKENSIRTISTCMRMCMCMCMCMCTCAYLPCIPHISKMRYYVVCDMIFADRRDDVSSTANHCPSVIPRSPSIHARRPPPTRAVCRPRARSARSAWIPQSACVSTGEQVARPPRRAAAGSP